MIAKSYDCLVIGAGPAGCTAAALLAEAGWRALLVERDKMPRFHVGESLMPETYWIFQRLGILKELRSIGFTKKNGVQFVNSADKESKPFFFSEHDPHESSQTWHVQRAEFDQLLFDTAMKQGATCVDNTRVLDVDLKNTPPHVVSLRTQDGKKMAISAKVVVDATGQQAMLANRLGLKEDEPELRKAAIWGYFENGLRNGGDNPEVTCILHTENRDAWFWYIPLSDGTVSVGLVGDNEFLLRRSETPEQTFQAELKNCPGLTRRLRDAQQVGKYYVAKEFSYSTTQHAGPGWVLIGDAFGFIDPIYSSGVYLALKSAEMAADSISAALHRGDLSGEQLGIWTDEFKAGVHWLRKLVYVFYENDFSFGDFMAAHPEHRANLTDLLIGRVFAGQPGRIFDDMDPWIEELKVANREA